MGFEPMLAKAIFANITRLIKAYYFLSSLFFYDTEALIAQLKGCLLDCFDWVSNILRVALMLAFRVMCHYALQKITLHTIRMDRLTPCHSCLFLEKRD